MDALEGVAAIAVLHQCELLVFMAVLMAQKYACVMRLTGAADVQHSVLVLNVANQEGVGGVFRSGENPFKCRVERLELPLNNGRVINSGVQSS